MRIAIVAPLVTAIREPQLGGSQTLVADIARGLVERDVDVEVFGATGSSIEGVATIDTGVDPDDLRSTLFRAGGGATDDTAARDAFTRAYALVRRGSYDVVHNHAFDVPAIELAPSDVPVVHTLHLPPSPQIAQAVRGRGHRVAAVSRFAAASWQPLVDVDVVLRNGVPTDRIPVGTTPRNGRLLYAGRISPEKGVVEAIEIARRSGRQITVVGDPYDERYAADEIETLRSADVVIRDAVPRAELWALMGAHSAVLCPVLWDEPFGLVAAEAQACGTPVIAFARGALGEVVRDGETGALVQDIGEAVDALGDLNAYDATMCRKHAETNLSIDATIDAHMAFYGRLVRSA